MAVRLVVSFHTAGCIVSLTLRKEKERVQYIGVESSGLCRWLVILGLLDFLSAIIMIRTLMHSESTACEAGSNLQPARTQ